MSWNPCAEPKTEDITAPAVDMVIIPRTGDIGNFEVHRALPFREKQMVGPFIFWDQMGPGEFLSNQGVDVRPHPHIGLSTVTYLFDGTMDHKDSLGNDTRIQPGDINLMTAGAGIVHSERTGQDIRKNPSRLFGIQSWMALPKSHEQTKPDFKHTEKKELPVFEEEKIKGRVILGEFQGISSPVKTPWETLYVDLTMSAGAKIAIPASTEERALYVLGGKIEISGTTYDPQQMMVLRPGDNVSVIALDDVRIMLLGGAAMDGPRHIWWNFVSSDKELMEQAKQDWKDGKFPVVPGDDKEFIPLP
jgi:redox-sensitive bicupin YhaK (pirin superfamily)